MYLLAVVYTHAISWFISFAALLHNSSRSTATTTGVDFVVWQSTTHRNTYGKLTDVTRTD